MKSPAKVAAIADRHKRLREATRLMAQADARAAEELARRDMATIVAHLDQGVPPVTLYRDTLDVSRGLFNRIIQRAPVVRPDPASEWGTVDAVAVARRAAGLVRHYTAVKAEALRIRDDTALALMNGRDDDGNRVEPVQNAAVARITGLSTARIAQIRTGV